MTVNNEAWRDWFPAQECAACGQEHPGADCPNQDQLPTEGDQK